MVIRHRDQRRRRVVIDEVASTNAQQSETGKAKPRKSRKKAAEKKEARAYAYGANRRNQLKTTDLIPKRLLAFSLVVLGLLAAIGVLNFLAANAPQWNSVLGSSSYSLAITGPGTISNWFVSFLLIISGIASLQIYALRQHRCDDYRGTYRLWLWLSALFLLASMNCVVDLRTIATNCIESLFQVQLSQSLWTVLVIKFILLTALIGRGIFEVRSSLGTVAIVVLGWLAYVGAMAMNIPSVQESMLVDHQTCYGNLFLIGTSCLLVAHLSYARFVYLMAHGLIKQMDRQEKIAAKQARKAEIAKAKADAIAEKAEAKAAAAQEKADKIQAEKDAVEQAKADRIAAKEAAIAEKLAAKEAAAADKLAKKQAALDAKNGSAEEKLAARKAKKEAALAAKAEAKAKKKADAEALRLAKLVKRSSVAETEGTETEVAEPSRSISLSNTSGTSSSSKSSGPLSSRIKSKVTSAKKSTKSSSKKGQSDIESEILKLSEARETLSKSELRRLRKLEKRQNRAA